MLKLAHVLTHARFAKWRRLMIFAAFLFAGIANPPRNGKPSICSASATASGSRSQQPAPRITKAQVNGQARGSLGGTFGLTLDRVAAALAGT